MVGGYASFTLVANATLCYDFAWAVPIALFPLCPLILLLPHLSTFPFWSGPHLGVRIGGQMGLSQPPQI